MTDNETVVDSTIQDNKLAESQWKTRRRLVMLILLFCGGLLGWIICSPTEVKTVETIAFGLVMLGGSTLTSYVAGSIIDDRTYMKASKVREVKQSKWQRRRLVIYITLVYCAFFTTYILVTGGDSNLLASIANSLIFLMGSTILTFIFGAVIDDWNYNKNKARDHWDR